MNVEFSPALCPDVAKRWSTCFVLGHWHQRNYQGFKCWTRSGALSTLQDQALRSEESCWLARARLCRCSFPRAAHPALWRDKAVQPLYPIQLFAFPRRLTQKEPSGAVFCDVDTCSLGLDWNLYAYLHRPLNKHEMITFGYYQPKLNLKWWLSVCPLLLCPIYQRNSFAPDCFFSWVFILKYLTYKHRACSNYGQESWGRVFFLIVCFWASEY